MLHTCFYDLMMMTMRSYQTHLSSPTKGVNTLILTLPYPQGYLYFHLIGWIGDHIGLLLFAWQEKLPHQNQRNLMSAFHCFLPCLKMLLQEDKTTKRYQGKDHSNPMH